MRFLVDTVVLSELSRNRPSVVVLNWFASVSPDNLYFSVAVIGEIEPRIVL